MLKQSYCGKVGKILKKMPRTKVVDCKMSALLKNIYEQLLLGMFPIMKQTQPQLKNLLELSGHDAILGCPYLLSAFVETTCSQKNQLGLKFIYKELSCYINRTE